VDKISISSSGLSETSILRGYLKSGFLGQESLERGTCGGVSGGTNVSCAFKKYNDH
jgi:hypothetical protein